MKELPINIDTLLENVDSGDVTVTAAYQYDRKGQRSYDDVAGPRNYSYGCDSDEILCTLTFVAGYGTPEWFLLKDEGDIIKKQDARDKVAILKQKAIEANQALNVAEAELENLEGAP